MSYCKEFDHEAFMMDFPINLAMDVLKCDSKEELPKLDLRSFDYLSGVYYALSTLKDDRMRKCIMLRYQDHMSYRAIGEVIGVTQERIRQIIVKALRILFHPSRRRYFMDSMSNIIRETNNELNEANAYIRDQIKEEPQKDQKQKYIGDILNSSIEVLDLSVRSFNCLKRANIETIGDLISINENDLLAIRNLGRKSAEEVVNKLKAIDLHLTDDETEESIRRLAKDYANISIIPDEDRDYVCKQLLVIREKIAATKEKHDLEMKEYEAQRIVKELDLEKARATKVDKEAIIRQQVSDILKSKFPNSLAQGLATRVAAMSDNERVVAILMRTEVFDPANPSRIGPFGKFVKKTHPSVLQEYDARRLMTVKSGDIEVDRFLEDHVEQNIE